MTVLSIDETHDHHDLYSSIGSSVTLIVVLTVTFLFTMTVLYILAPLIIVCSVYKESPVFQTIKSIEEIHHHITCILPLAVLQRSFFF